MIKSDSLKYLDTIKEESNDKSEISSFSKDKFTITKSFMRKRTIDLLKNNSHS